jgi:hypothetical protein
MDMKYNFQSKGIKLKGETNHPEPLPKPPMRNGIALAALWGFWMPTSQGEQCDRVEIISESNF